MFDPRFHEISAITTRFDGVPWLSLPLGSVRIRKTREHDLESLTVHTVLPKSTTIDRPRQSQGGGIRQVGVLRQPQQRPRDGRRSSLGFGIPPAAPAGAGGGRWGQALPQRQLDRWLRGRREVRDGAV